MALLAGRTAVPSIPTRRGFEEPVGVEYMRALSVERFVGFQELEWVDVPRPVPGEHETLVRVLAVALSRSDLAGLTDRAMRTRRPWIPGVSITGEIVEGSRFPVGTRVVIDPYIACGSCRTCQASGGCMTPNVIGRQLPGGLAEFVTCPTDRVVPVPRIMSLESGAAFAASGSIASKILYDDLHLQPGERLLLTGSTGSLGLTVVLLARAFGADVTALVSRADRVGLATKAGAHTAIPIRYEGNPLEPQDLGGGVDAIVHLGRDGGWIEPLIDCLLPGGRILVRRLTSGESQTIDVGRLAVRGLRLIGSTGAGRSGLAQAVQTLAAAPHSVLVDEVITVEQIGAGFERLATHQNRGAIALRFPP